ncbi:chitobiase/beta-hexosaminidase C-terminal domain-containing protein [candidate division KSB1 bacterium]|nr:chitobiase/beta-hexosaminidase C-terminal domain-containing protein [candidate division KSB1 bacterium]
MKSNYIVRFLFILVLLIASIRTLSANDDKIPAFDQLQTKPVTIGYSFTLHSNIMDEDRIIQVALPGGYETSDNRYPVLYITDGQWHFNHATQAHGTLCNRFMPEMILVSVHTMDRRNHDLLPPATRDKNGATGEADKFLKFITDELTPFVEKNYRTYPYRVLFGSSFGGVFVMHAFTTAPSFFNAYIATSPSMWWDNQIMIARTGQLLMQHPELNNRLYITLANEGFSMGVSSLAEVLKKRAPRDLKWKYEKYPDEWHETVSYKGMYNGLKFIFKGWSPEPVEIISEGDLIAPGDEVTVKMKSKTGDIYFTLDGSFPAGTSAQYQNAMTITKPTVIKAVPMFEMGLSGKIAELSIKFVPKFEAQTELPDLKNGLAYTYYEGDWDTMPDFTQLKAMKSGITQNFNLEERKQSEMFAIKYTGYFYAPEDDIYTFYLSSDDGGQLSINDSLIVDNDGLHAMIEKSGKAYLKQGMHRIDVQFFQKGGGCGLSLEYETPKIKKAKIPTSAFSCSGAL